jgi:nucleotide-binding universal stress UspA family protein
LALDDRILEDGTIFNVPLTIAKNLGVKIDIIHVDKKEKVVPYDPFISSYLGKSIGEVILETTYKDPIRVIKSYSENGNYGMIIMVHRSRSFFQRLFLDSNSAQEVEIINVPLLILPDHLNDKDHAQ